MKKSGLIIAAVAALGVTACERGATTNSAAVNGNGDIVDVNGAALREATENGVQDVQNAAANAAPVIENGLDRAGNAIENAAASVRNEAREVAREADREVNTETNTTGR